MNKPLATWALAAIPGLLLAGCNGSSGGGSGIAALPNTAATAQHRVRSLDNGSQDLHAGGADMPGYAYNLGVQPVGYYYNSQPGPGAGSLFFAAPTTGTTYYCITGSTDGRKAFEGEGDSGFPPTGPCPQLGQSVTGFGGRQDPLDFVGTAVALASTECCASGTPYYNGRLSGSVTWGQPFEFPQIGASIVFGYRPNDFAVSALKLSTWTYCAIANGTVHDWNDSAITADNGGTSVTGGTSETILFYFRSDGGATTFDLQNHLNTVCNKTWKAPYNQYPYQGSGRSAAWTFGVNNAWEGPGSSGDPNSNFVGEIGDPGIIASIQTTPFSTGYVTGGYVKSASPKVGQAWLQNGFKKGRAIFVNPAKRVTLVKALAKIRAANIEYGMGNDGNPLGSSTPWCQLYIPTSAYVSPPASSYPIVGISYLLFYGQNNGVHVSDKKKLLTYLESHKANVLVDKLEYTSLSKSIESAVISAFNGNSSQPACLQ